MQFEALLEIMKSCGIVGAGGAGFPSYAKLNKKADTIILNCAECEPLFRMHRQLLAKYAFEILTALEHVREAVNAERIIIAIKPSYKDAIEAVKDKAQSFKNVTVAQLPEVYPAGDEVVTIYEATGRVVPPGQIPISVGCIVFNVETMLNTYYAIEENRPVTMKYVTVGGAVKNPTTYYVPLGMKFSELISLAGGATVENFAVLSGGVMTGRLGKMTEVVTKTTNAVLVLPENHPVILKRKSKTSLNIKRSMSSCCQCSSCTDLCPRYLLGHPIEPHLFMRAVSKGMENDSKAVINTLYCAQCGICEMYACPQGLSPKSIMADCRDMLRAKGLKPEPLEPEKVHELRPYRKVQMKRLLSRLGLMDYVVKAPMDERELKPREVKIMFRQHIGAPASPIIKKGDKIKKNQLMAEAADGLSVPVFSSIDGKVTELTADYAVVRA